MNDLLDDLHGRYAGPSSAEGRLPDKLRLLDIGRLAYPKDNGDAFRFALVLHRAVEAGDLKAASTGTFYCSHPANMQAVMRHVVDRVDFATFLQAQGKQPTGRIAEWVADAMGAAPAPEAHPPGKQPHPNMVKAYWMAFGKPGKNQAAKDAIAACFPDEHPTRQETLTNTLRDYLKPARTPKWAKSGR
ncbi:hypothetical protein [Thiohalocapsa marina]|uniref:hypothetical protein n=1 Tax=Thiohalocapsa marina TaxID=424902 RepID=UPI0036D7BE1C